MITLEIINEAAFTNVSGSQDIEGWCCVCFSREAPADESTSGLGMINIRAACRWRQKSARVAGKGVTSSRHRAASSRPGAKDRANDAGRSIGT